MKLSLVVAVAENNVIGRDGQLPWHLPADLRRFKQLTMGHVLVMGRKTYESIGRPLPGRVSMVLTRQPDYQVEHERVVVVHSLDEALKRVPQTGMDPAEVFVVGGAGVYRLALPRADRLYRTVVHTEAAGEVTFPEVDFHQWRLVESERYPADAKNEFAMTHEVYQRAAPSAPAPNCS